MEETHVTELLAIPMLTANITGIGGELKRELDDFRVVETPLYDPDEEGDHVFLWLEKRGVDAMGLVEQVAAHLKIERRDIGVAGMKDRQAITKQWISVPYPVDKDANELLGPIGEDIEILKAIRHTRKLKRGHLKGNRFQIRIRNVEDAPDDIEKIASILRSTGVPNLFGEQRFGRGMRTFWMGYTMLKSGEIPKRLRRNRRLRDLSLHAVQSAVFNQIVARRISSGHLNKAMLGDIVETQDEGLMRVFPENIDEANRLLSIHEGVILGPLIGDRMLTSQLDAEALEDKVLEEFELTRDAFSQFPKALRGARRPFTIALPDLELSLERNGEINLLTAFSLPSGSYATVLLEEFMHSNSDV